MEYLKLMKIADQCMNIFTLIKKKSNSANKLYVNIFHFITDAHRVCDYFIRHIDKELPLNNKCNTMSFIVLQGIFLT